MRFILADQNLVVQNRVYAGFPLLIGDDGDAIQPAQDWLWQVLTRPGRVNSPKTWDAYGRAIYDFFAYAITNNHDWRMPSIAGAPCAIEAWRDWSKGTLNLRARTINQRLRVVIRFYQWAEREGLIDSLPFDYAEVQTRRDAGFLDHVDERGGKASSPEVLLREEARAIRYLTKEQIAVCHETLTNQTHQLLFELMVRTGLRQMEARSFPDAYIFDPARRRDITRGQRIRVALNPRDMEIKLGKGAKPAVEIDCRATVAGDQGVGLKKRSAAQGTGRAARHRSRQSHSPRRTPETLKTLTLKKII